MCEFACACVCVCLRVFVRRGCLVGTPPARSYILEPHPGHTLLSKTKSLGAGGHQVYQPRALCAVAPLLSYQETEEWGDFWRRFRTFPPRGHSQADGWRTVARGGVGGVTVSGVLGLGIGSNGERCVCVVCVSRVRLRETFRGIRLICELRSQHI